MTEPSRRPPIVLFCHIPYGIGHWMRTAALVSQLQRRFAVTLLIGGRFTPELQIPPGVQSVVLPMKYRDENDQIVCSPGLSLREVNQACLRVIRDTVKRVRPVAVIVEYYPFGHWENWGEVLQLIEAAKYPLLADPAAVPVAICSLRDIQQTKRPHQQYFDSEVCELANTLFDAIWVHADPSFARLEDTFPLTHRLRVPVCHTGFVVPEEDTPAASPGPPENVVVVSAGGGLAGESLLQRAIAAYKTSTLAQEFRMRIVAGIFQSEEAWARLEAAAQGVAGLQLLRWVPNLRAEMARAAVSVSRCGYNTALDVLRSQARCLLVPYATPNEDEQTNRAGRMERLGVARVLPEDEASPERLAAEIRATARFQPAPANLQFTGASQSAKLLEQLLRDRGFPIAGEAAELESQN